MPGVCLCRIEVVAVNVIGRGAPANLTVMTQSIGGRGSLSSC